MARPLRIEYEGALYHILSRGNDQRDIFVVDDDRVAFLKALGEMSERFEISIFAYVLMDNHYHLLLRTNKANLSKSMQWLGTTYTRRFNLRHFRSGHLFQGRYKSILVQNDAYLTQLSCYIHRNPLRAGIVDRLADYRWSSYRAYAYKRRPPSWLDTQLILSRFDGEERHKAYREKVQRYSQEEKQVWEDLRHGFVYGTKSFLDQIKYKYLSQKADAEFPQLSSILKDKDPADLLKKAATILNCNIDEFRESVRISEKDKIVRDILLLFLWETGLYTNREIGKFFGLSYSAVSRRVHLARSRINKPDAMGHKYEQLKSQIKV
jgi:putative transposase